MTTSCVFVERPCQPVCVFKPLPGHLLKQLCVCWGLDGLRGLSVRCFFKIWEPKIHYMLGFRKLVISQILECSGTDKSTWLPKMMDIFLRTLYSQYTYKTHKNMEVIFLSSEVYFKFNLYSYLIEYS